MNDKNVPELSFLEDNERCECFLTMFSLLSNEYRLKILCLLRTGDYCVNDIAEFVGGKFSNISQQLKMLTLAGYLTKEKIQKQVYYHLSDIKIKKTLDFLHKEFDSPPEKAE